MNHNQNYKQPGDVVTLVAPYARATSGLGALVGAVFGVSMAPVENGAEGQFERTGVHTLAKTSAQAWSQGDRIYWDDTNKRCDTDSALGPCIGAALEDADNPSSTGVVLLVPGLALLEGAQTAIADLTFGTNIAAATANGSLTDSSATNPTDAQFNELAKELGTKVNGILAVLRSAGVLKAA